MFKDEQDPNYLLQIIKNHLSIVPDAYIFYLHHSDQILNDLMNVELKNLDESTFSDNPEQNILKLKFNI